MEHLGRPIGARAHDSKWHKGEALGTATDFVSYVRDFCRADEATRMPLHDPYLSWAARTLRKAIVARAILL